MGSRPSSARFNGDEYDITRRGMLRMVAGACAAASAASVGCSTEARTNSGTLELVWGQRGNKPGYLQKPRAVAVDDQDQLYFADMTDRIQVFSVDGEFLHHWRLPDFNVDGPTGLSIDNDGNLLVADTHFYRILIFTPDGDLVGKIAGTQGTEPGQFGYVRDCVQDANGFLYTCEYGEFDRIQVISPEHKFIAHWGGHGREPGEFLRPEGLAFDRQGRLFVSDSCNHRIQVFTTAGKLVDLWGTYGTEIGQLSYPYDIAFDSEDHLYVCEWGNDRVQKFTADGKPLGAFGRTGRRDGELNHPWALTVDRHKRVHVADSENHRVQRIVL